MSTPGLAADTISVIVCAYTLDRWDSLCAALESVHRQTLAPLETIVVVDANDALERRAHAGLSGVEVLSNTHDRGLSGARQTGAEEARGSILAFLDDDAMADADWLARLAAAYQDPRVLGVGGLIEPVWEQPPPRWFPPEFNWVVGCSYAGMPLTAERVRNPIGANMSLRAVVLERAGAFDSRFGRAPGAKALSGSAEETELCIRAAREHPGHYWIYEPRARVVHAVPPERGTWRYFVRRCVVEGSAKASLSAIAGRDDGLRSERVYVRTVLPRALLRELGGGVRGHVDGFARASAIVAGLAITVAAYAATRCAAAARGARRARSDTESVRSVQRVRGERAPIDGGLERPQASETGAHSGSGRTSCTAPNAPDDGHAPLPAASVLPRPSP